MFTEPARVAFHSSFVRSACLVGCGLLCWMPNSESRLHVFLGRRLSPGETNSPRTCSYLWGCCSSLAPARRGPCCRSRHGGDAFRQRHSLASRPRRRRQAPHPRTLREPPTQTARIRRRHHDRAPRQPKAPPLETSTRQKTPREDSKTTEASVVGASLLIRKRLRAVLHPNRRKPLQNSGHDFFRFRHSKMSG
jgi:hypothetical protein